MDDDIDPEQGTAGHEVPAELIELHELLELRDAEASE